MKFCDDRDKQMFEMTYNDLLPKVGRTSGPYWTMIRRYVDLWKKYLEAEAYIQELTEMFETETIESGLAHELAENKRLRRMVNWALKPETQIQLQADFDEFDRMTKNTGNA